MYNNKLSIMPTEKYFILINCHKNVKWNFGEIYGNGFLPCEWAAECLEITFSYKLYFSKIIT